MNRKIENSSFYISLAIVTIGFGLILKPFFSAILWAILLTIIFLPLQTWLEKRIPRRPLITTLITLVAILLIVILPLSLLTTAIASEGAALYAWLNSEDVDFQEFAHKLRYSVPYVDVVAEWAGIDLNNLKTHLSASAAQAGKIVGQYALNVGQNTFQFSLNFVMSIYLTFFLLRDHHRIIKLIIRALPLGDDRERALFSKFAEVSRATIKGNLVVAIVQGFLGGVIFWFLDIQGAILWAVIMALLSLIPAVGAALIWLPAAIYLLVVGQIWEGAGLIVYGMFVIGLADNILRPILVGRDTKMPDYLILLSTLGGIVIFGINGFVIGPAIAALFIAFWEIFAVEFNTSESTDNPKDSV